MTGFGGRRRVSAESQDEIELNAAVNRWIRDADSLLESQMYNLPKRVKQRNLARTEKLAVQGMHLLGALAFTSSATLRRKTKTVQRLQELLRQRYVDMELSDTPLPVAHWVGQTGLPLPGQPLTLQVWSVDGAVARAPLVTGLAMLLMTVIVMVSILRGPPGASWMPMLIFFSSGVWAMSSLSPAQAIQLRGTSLTVRYGGLFHRQRTYTLDNDQPELLQTLSNGKVTVRLREKNGKLIRFPGFLGESAAMGFLEEVRREIARGAAEPPRSLAKMGEAAPLEDGLAENELRTPG